MLIIIKGIVLITREHHLEDAFPCIRIGNSTVSRGIWDKINTTSDISKFTTISRATVGASDIWGVLKYH